MRIKDLITLLKQYNENFEVKISNNNWGSSIDIKDVSSEIKTYAYEEDEETIINIECNMGGF